MLIRTSKDKDHPYVILNKTFLVDKNLSLKAKGLLAFCMQMPNDWQFYVKQLETMLKEKEEAIRSAFNELIKHNYCVRYKKRNDKGVFESQEFILFETPQDPEELKKLIPQRGFPDVAKPDVANQVLLNKNIIEKEKQRQPQTPTKEEVVVVVDNLQDLAIANKMQTYLEKFSQQRNDDWKISCNDLYELAKNYGRDFVSDQLNYMVKQQQQAEKDEKIPYKKRKTPIIDKPLTFLKMACERNWADSKNWKNERWTLERR